MKSEIKVLSKIKFISVEFPIEVQSFKCTAEIQLVVGEDGELLKREYKDFRNVEFMGLPVDSFFTFRIKMREDFGVNIMTGIEDAVEKILTEKVCKKIISENII
jgi:hypothetical protein